MHVSMLRIDSRRKWKIRQPIQTARGSWKNSLSPIMSEDDTRLKNVHRKYDARCFFIGYASLRPMTGRLRRRYKY